VRLRSRNGLVELEVEDHGVGMPSSRRRADAAGGADRRGLGLVTMRERADLVGGTIEFAQPPEGGTLVRLRVPMGRSDAGEEEADGR
jgi:signal transduction histidine kinase